MDFIWNDDYSAAYYIVPSMTYAECQATCQTFGANLATPESMEEVEFIDGQLVSHFTWLGINDLEEEGKHYWGIFNPTKQTFFSKQFN